MKIFKSSFVLLLNSLRLKYGTSTLKNAFHCSVDEATAEKEIRFFFPNGKLSLVTVYRGNNFF